MQNKNHSFVKSLRLKQFHKTMVHYKTYHLLLQQCDYRLRASVILRQKTLRCIYQNLIRGITQNLVPDISIPNIALGALCILMRIVRISCCMF